VESHLLITAYLHGADGVLVMGCLLGQCHYKEGNYHARWRMALLKSIFETLGSGCRPFAHRMGL
jgi:F420-non-reducing hydrogenase iron-sulfur subunit